ncbi:chemotaxis protein CheD [Halobacteriales archaeon QS_5_70_15]|nr:MAG: chemotaxis protein CheD [Halobacteriales archaeon QS_5_70_15]
MKTYRSDSGNPDRNRLFVGVAEYDVATDGETLIAYGLGACVGVLLYDPARVGGLAHAMLPRQTDDVSTSEAKFVESAVEALLRDVVAAGATIGRLEGYIAGGAEVFDLHELPSDVIERNVAVAREIAVHLFDADADPTVLRHPDGTEGEGR